MTLQYPNGQVEFRFHRPGASQVWLVGEFNEWKSGRSAMHPRGDGWWSLRCWLDPGCYHFLYEADGAWFPDYAAFGLVQGPFGWNSVVYVSPAVEEAVEVSEVRPGSELIEADIEAPLIGQGSGVKRELAQV